MREIILLDAGSLVALLYRRDQFHKWAVEQIGNLPTPLLTCEAVIAEACFLTYKRLGTSRAVYDFMATGAAKIDFSLQEQFADVQKLAARYQNVPMSLADACLVRMSELHAVSRVFTTDSDFIIYRKNGHQQIPVIMPAGLY